MTIRTLLLIGCFSLATFPLLAQSPQEISMYQSAEKTYLAGNYQNAFEQLNDYVRTYPSGSYILAAVYNRANSLAMLKRYEEALSDYDYVSQAGNNPYVTSARQRSQQVKDKMAEKQSAIPSAPVQSNTGSVPFGGQVTTGQPSTGSQSYADRNPVLNAYFQAVGAYQAYNFGLAEPHLQTVINLDRGELAAEARYMQAKIAFVKGDYARARDLARASAAAGQGYPFWVAKSVLVMSDALYELNDLNASRSTLQALAQDYTQDPTILNEARAKLARFDSQSSSAYPNPR